MPLTSYKKFIITLLLLAFTCQSMATSAMTCELEKIMLQQSVAMNTNNAMVHAHHHMGEMPMHDMSAMGDMDHASQSNNKHQQFDCCKIMGHCLSGACSLAAASTIESFLFTKARSTLVDFYSSISPSPIIPSLYRPPIIC